MLVQVPTHANVANESMRTNIPGSLASNVILLIAVPLSLMVHWDLLGIASGVLISRVVDLVIRSRSTRRWVNLVPASPIPRELSDTMRSFGLKATYISLVAMVIWDKSDLVLLKALTTDIGQITFFTMAYNLVEKVILAPAVFGASLSASLMAQYGRDRGKTPALAAQAIRYLYLFSLPMLLGLSLTSDPLIRVLYGSGFLPAIRVLQFAGVLAILKPVSYASDAMFRATGRQKMVVIWTTLGAFQNVLLDYLLIPRYGAVGAAIGSGVAVSTQVVIYLIILKASFDVPLDVKGLGKITLAGLLMAAPVLVSNAFLPPLAAVLIDPVAGGAIFLLAIKAFRLLHETDVERLGRLCDMFPSSVRPLLYRLIGFLATSAPLQPVADPQ
jgi:O-antigen/teichoic acid export membrane protein